MSDDHSPGDARKPYSDRGGPGGRHAETHDTRREELTNPRGPEPVDESFDEDLAKETPESIRQAQMESVPAGDDKTVIDSLPEMTQDELAELSMLPVGTPLEQGAVYLDLNKLDQGEFKAMGGTEVSAQDRIVAKKATDYQLWNRLTGDPH
ncbi:MAG TPA: hypothetical protein VGR08_06920 [Thermomicrobiales bacterium]|nr:hypothetical protein [Thermomicrobiales bacterium]